MSVVTQRVQCNGSLKQNGMVGAGGLWKAEVLYHER